MSTLLTRTVNGLRDAGRTAVVPFLTAGYPDLQTSRRLLAAAAAAGCRLVEIGVPFSDPVADGPAIQLASRRALDAGMTLAGAVDLAGHAARELGLVPVLMGYLNPVLAYGPERFGAACAGAGVAGVIVPDLPLEEAAGLRALLLEHGVSLVDLVAPTTGPGRLAAYGRAATGFLYLVSTTGVTGAGVGQDIAGYAARVRTHCALPLYVGFGIGDAASAVRVAADADGVIIGSALQRLVAGAATPDAAVAAVGGFLQEVTAAVAGVHRDSG
ncbi:MAG: tryptophan synthase subunit alpha [Krumholzibacteria bacterium]|nr:tryptophan synthase subunit alpha [Candidatus Krumholzibacteria bacterium]